MVDWSGQSTLPQRRLQNNQPPQERRRKTANLELVRKIFMSPLSPRPHPLLHLKRLRRTKSRFVAVFVGEVKNSWHLSLSAKSAPSIRTFSASLNSPTSLDLVHPKYQVVHLTNLDARNGPWWVFLVGCQEHSIKGLSTLKLTPDFSHNLQLAAACLKRENRGVLRGGSCFHQVVTRSHLPFVFGSLRFGFSILETRAREFA